MDDLSKAHNYKSVDIRTLNVWERTFVPEARKKPIFDRILHDIPWSVRPNVVDKKLKMWVPIKNTEQCKQILTDLKEWKNVTIIEPEIRANRYVAPPFDAWRQQCPKFNPHYSKEYVRVGTHHFKSFSLPELSQNSKLFYFQGNASGGYFGADGRIDPTSSRAKFLLENNQTFVPEGNGSFAVVNLEQCERATGMRGAGGIGYSYYFAKTEGPYRGRYSESVVLRLNGKPYILYGSVKETRPDLDRLAIFDFELTDEHPQESLCEYEQLP